MAKKNQIEILILAKDEATKTFKGVTGAIGGMQAAIVAAGALLAVKQLGDMLISTAKAAAVQEAAESKLAVALARHGETSDEALQSAIDFAGGLQLTTTAGDETTIAVQALLLNMGVLPENLNKATQASLDYAAATGKDFREAAIQAAKTLSGLDGELGELLPDLKSLTIEQKKAGAAFDLLSSKFGGEAAAQARGFAGRITQLGNVFGDLQEQIGFNITRSESFKTAIAALTQFFADLGTIVEDIPIGDILVEWARLFVTVTGGAVEFTLTMLDMQRASLLLSESLPGAGFTGLAAASRQAIIGNEILEERLLKVRDVLGDLSLGLEKAAAKSGILTGKTREQVAAEDAATKAANARAAALKTLREEITKNSKAAIAEANKARVALIQNDETRVKAQFAIRLSEIAGLKANEEAKTALRDVAFQKLEIQLKEIGAREADIAAENIDRLTASMVGAFDDNKAAVDAGFDDFLSFEGSQEISDRVKELQNELVLVGLTGADAINERMSQQLAALKTGLDRGLILQEEFDAERALLIRRGSDELIEIEEQKFQGLNAIAATAGGAVATLLADNIKAGLAGEKVSTEDAIKGFILAITNAALASVGLGFLSPVAGALIGSVGGTRRHLGGMITAHNGITSNRKEQPIMALQNEAILSESAVARLGGPASVIALNAGTGGGAGGNVTVNIQTMDGGSMDQFLRHRGGGQAVVEFLEREGIG